jgi:dihydroflavonol-4-reductase
MARALVTGGTGFVGSHIARALIQAGHTVRVLHRESSKLTALEGVPFESSIGGLTDSNALRAACEGVKWVFHVAAVADYWRADKDAMYAANVEGTRQLLRAADQAGVARVVFTSSAAAVGLRDDRPADESEPFNMRPNQFPYGHSKWLAEGVVKEAVDAGQDVVTVNPVVIMGPGDLNMISGDFVRQVKKFGMFTPVTSGGISVTDVRDIARWHIQAAEVGQTGERYILGTANYDYQTWFNMIAEVVGVARPRVRVPRFAAELSATAIDLARKVNIPTVIDAAQARLGTKDVYFNCEKAWAAFGQPQIDMMQSLHDTYTWYAENGYL